MTAIKITKIAMTTAAIQALLPELVVTEKQKQGGISVQGHRYSLTVNSFKQL